MSDHVVTSTRTGKFKCEFCGAEEKPPFMPAPINIIIDAIDVFIAKHKNCKPPAQDTVMSELHQGNAGPALPDESGLTPRMEAALALADKCWGRANRVRPDFVERYLELAEQLLLTKPVVTGDEFREHCANNRLYRPSELHHNTWVSAVRALQQIGWIKPMGKIEPQKNHNHMETVTMWKSQIYGEEPTHDKVVAIQSPLF